jgi:hypothetical protein
MLLQFPPLFGSEIGCPSKLVSIRNNRNWNRNLFRHYPKQNVCFGCFASIPKQKVSMFRLNRNKQKTNRNSLIGSIFCNFLQKIYGFFGFFVFFRFFSRFFRFFLGFFSLFRNSLFRCFGCFASIPKQRVSIDPKQTEDPPKQFKRDIGYFSENLGLFRFVTVCYETVLFVSVVSIQVRKTETNRNFVFGFTKQTETKAKQILFRFVSVRTENYFCLFRGHPNQRDTFTKLQ